MRRIALFLFVALLTAAVRAEDWSIVPGSSVGPVKLGMKLSEVEAPSKALPKSTGQLVRKGEILAPDPKGRGKIIKYTRYGGLEVQWEPRAISIAVLKSSISVNGRTVNLVGPGGVRVGGTLASIQTALGQWDEARDLKPQKNTTSYLYKRKGIYFIVQNGKITSITVFREAN